MLFLSGSLPMFEFFYVLFSLANKYFLSLSLSLFAQKCGDHALRYEDNDPPDFVTDSPPLPFCSRIVPLLKCSVSTMRLSWDDEDASDCMRDFIPSCTRRRREILTDEWPLTPDTGRSRDTHLSPTALRMRRPACSRWVEKCRDFLWSVKAATHSPHKRTSWKLVGNPGCELVAN